MAQIKAGKLSGLSSIAWFAGLIISSLLAHADGGGAGVNKNGVFMTFYSAGLYVESNIYADPFKTIPGLWQLNETIENNPYLGLDTKAKILDAIVPTNDRRYLIATPAALTPAVMKDLLAQFQKATGQNPATLQLYALTDTVQKITYLLPAFFQLKTITEKEAALMHENFWILFPNSQYSQVIHTEEAFQAYIEQPTDYRALYDFISQITSDPNDMNRTALGSDSASQGLKGFVDAKNTASLLNLFGQDYFDCVVQLNANSSDPDYQTYNLPFYEGIYESPISGAAKGTACASLLRQHIADLEYQYPNAFTFLLMGSRFDSAKNGVLFFQIPTSAYSTGHASCGWGTVTASNDPSVSWDEYQCNGDSSYMPIEFIEQCRLDFSNLQPSADKPNLVCPTVAGTDNSRNIGGSGYFDFGAAQTNIESEQ